jgi:hypothetical protein
MRYSYEQVDKAQREVTKESLERHADVIMQKVTFVSDQIEWIGKQLAKDTDPLDMLVSLAHIKTAIRDLQELDKEINWLAGDLMATRAEISDLLKS